MKYVIMCGGTYTKFEKPRQLYEVNGEVLIERTIRLLRENGVDDITLTVQSDKFDYLKEKYQVDIVWNVRKYSWNGEKLESRSSTVGYWVDAFMDFQEPTCYIFGDVYFSPETIETIVGTEVTSTTMFGSQRPFGKGYIKRYEEPFAFTVTDTQYFFDKLVEIKLLYNQGKVDRHPIAWEVYRHLNGYDINTHILKENYVGIHDYSCDVDDESDITKIENKLKEIQHGSKAKSHG